MSKVIEGHRVGKAGELRPAACGVVFDETGRVLLTRRTDNGQWCLPGGHMEPGESIAEACAREVLEETGLIVNVQRLTGVYSTPHRLVEYPDGNKAQFIVLAFECSVASGELTLSDETTAFGYYTIEEMKTLDMLHGHDQRIYDALERKEAAIVR